MGHMVNGNIGLMYCRQQSQSGEWELISVTQYLTESCAISNKTKEIAYVSPFLLEGVNHNVKARLFPDLVNYEYLHFSNSDRLLMFYSYATLHSRQYRQRYAEFLKGDFPRIPLTKDVVLFRRLADLGGELIDFHLLKSPDSSFSAVSYPVAGTDRVDNGFPMYVAPGEKDLISRPFHTPAPRGRVYINRHEGNNDNAQYFEGITPEAWNFHIGGYQVLEKWLKDRRGRTLSADDREHYRKVVKAIVETIRVMKEIDEAIPGWPLP